MATPSGDAIDIATSGGCGSVDAWLEPGERTTLDGRSIAPGWNLTRFDTEGAVEWIRSLVPSATTNFGVWAASRLPDGGVVIGGQYATPVDFGNGVPFEGGSSLDGFLARYDGAGNLIKVSRFGNHGVYDLVTNDAGDVLLYMPGYDAVDFGNGPTSVSDYVELAADGQFRWSVPRVGSITIHAGGVHDGDGFALRPGGDAVVTGTRWVPLPDDESGTVEVVVSYDSSGKAIREQTFQGPSAAALALQPNGDTVLLPGPGLGPPATPADFGCGAFPAAASLVVVALRRDGTCHWMHGFSGTIRAQLATDGAGGVLVAGETNDQIVTDLASGAVLGANEKFFMVRLDESGQLAWGRTLGRAAVGFVSGLGKIAFSSSGIWLAGYFSAPIDFGTGSLIPVGSTDGFLLRLAP